MPEEEKERIPIISLYEVLRWRRKFGDVLVPDFVAEDMDCATLDAAAKAVSRPLDKSRNRPIPDEIARFDKVNAFPAVRETLTAAVGGRVLSPELAEHVIARMAGNVIILKSGTPITPWTSQMTPEWVIGMVRSVKEYRTPRRHIRGVMVTFYIVSGGPADETLTQFFTNNAFRRLAYRIGILKRRSQQILHPRELVRTYLLLKIRPGHDLHAEKYMERESLNKRNKARVAKRRDYKKVCPLSGDVRAQIGDWPCHFCHMGYDSCPLGTHRRDYIPSPCPGGHKGYYDPKQTNGYCLHCRAKRWLSKF